MYYTVVKLVGKTCEVFGDVDIGSRALQLLFFGPVYGGIGGTVHHIGKAVLPHESAHSIGISQVKYTASRVERPVAQQAAKLAAGDKYAVFFFHNSRRKISENFRQRQASANLEKRK